MWNPSSARRASLTSLGSRTSGSCVGTEQGDLFKNRDAVAVWAFEFLQRCCAQEELLKRMTTILAYELIDGHYYLPCWLKAFSSQQDVLSM